jgi:hypothetical protein
MTTRRTRIHRQSTHRGRQQPTEGITSCCPGIQIHAAHFDGCRIRAQHGQGCPAVEKAGNAIRQQDDVVPTHRENHGDDIVSGN